MATAVQPDFLAKFAKMMDAYPGAGLREIIRLTPDSLLLGTGFLGLITQNYALGMLFAALFETAFITVGLQSLFGYISLKDNPRTRDRMDPRTCIPQPLNGRRAHLRPQRRQRRDCQGIPQHKECPQLTGTK